MGLADVGIFAGTVGVCMALIEVIKILARKRNGANGESPILIDINRDQLKVLHDIDKELAAIRNDLRSLWIAQNHLDRKVDALHRRYDSDRRAAREQQ